MVNINWEELCEALGDYTETKYYFLNKQTGEILVLSEFMSEATKSEIRKKVGKSKASDYIPVPRITSRDGYKMMEDFVSDVRDEKFKSQLTEVLQKEAPFRKFKELVLRHPEERKRWIDFRQKKLTELAETWLKKEKVIP